MKKNKKKAILVCFDGVPFNLLDKWILEGKLKTFEKLISQGVYGKLRCVPPSSSDASAIAACTGKNAGKTGVTCFMKPDGRIFSFSDVEEPTAWDILGDYGYESCVFSLPMTYPPREMKGILICGNPPKNSKNAYPSKYQGYDDTLEVYDDIILRLGKNPKKNKEEIVKKVKFLLSRKYELFKKLMKGEKIDFGFFWMYSILQNYYWDEKKNILEIYKLYDNVLADIIESFPDYELFIFSDHGFEKKESYSFYLNSWLLKNGYPAYMENKWGIRINTEPIKDMSHKLMNNFTNFRQAADLIYSFFIYQIFKNKSKKMDYNSLTNSIVKNLMSLRRDGKKVIKEVWKRDELFFGEHIKELPDIIFLTNEDYLASNVLSPFIFRKKLPDNRFTGKHFPSACDGIFMAYGKNIKSGVRLDASLLDLVPTILYSFNIPKAKDMDGKTLKQIFKKISLKSRKKIKTKKEIKKPKKDLSKKEEKELKERLKNLGYI